MKTIYNFFVLVGVLMLFTMPWWPAHANHDSCGPREVGVSELDKRFGEEAAHMGIDTNGSVVEVFTSEKGTFTIMKTRTDGISCVVLEGDSWENLVKPLKGEGA